MITAEILEAADTVLIRAKRKLTSVFEGNYRSAFRGHGMQFKEFRPYEQGDDIRHMSWTVTARTGRPTVKVYEQERELDVVVFVDTSGSSLSGCASKRKVDLYADCLATIGLSAIRAGDNFGLILFNESVSRFLPPRHHSNQVRVALTHLLSSEFQGRTANLSNAIEFSYHSLRHRSLAIVLSDFWVPPFETPLAVASRRHEFILVQAVEPLAHWNGLVEVTDPETGDIYLLSGQSKDTRQTLQQRQLESQTELEKLTARTRGSYLNLSVEDDYVRRLVLFFEQRGPTRL